MIWSTPASKLSADFGVSDVAIAKHCKKLNVPRPSRGYWAKVQAGRKSRKAPLPPTPEEVFEQAAQKPVPKLLALPKTDTPLHPLAAELLRVLNAAKPDSENRVRIRERSLPETDVTKALAERVAQALHAILQGVEPVGILFRKTQSSYEGGHFKRGHDSLYFQIEEELVDRHLEPGATNRRRSSWQWQRDSRVPSGRLTFTLKTRKWTENDDAPLRGILSQIVTEIRQHYVEAQQRRAQEAIEREKQRVQWEADQRRYREQEEIRKEEERKRRHAEAIQTAVRTRKEDLLKAAEWWRLCQVTQEFIAACEQRWRSQQSGELKAEQETWLQWARKTAGTLSPFEKGYPDPEKDGAFSALTVPMGGPYPETREFSRPPSMPEIPAPVVVQQGYGAPSHEPAPKPYPFWLKYQR